MRNLVIALIAVCLASTSFAQEEGSQHCTCISWAGVVGIPADESIASIQTISIVIRLFGEESEKGIYVKCEDYPRFYTPEKFFDCPASHPLRMISVNSEGVPTLNQEYREGKKKGKQEKFSFYRVTQRSVGEYFQYHVWVVDDLSVFGNPEQTKKHTSLPWEKLYSSRYAVYKVMGDPPCLQKQPCSIWPSKELAAAIMRDRDEANSLRED